MKKLVCISALIGGLIGSQALAEPEKIILKTQDNWSSYYYCTTPSTAKNLSHFLWTRVNVPQQKIVWYNGTTGDPCSAGTQITCPPPSSDPKYLPGLFYVDNTSTTSRGPCRQCPKKDPKTKKSTIDACNRPLSSINNF